MGQLYLFNNNCGRPEDLIFLFRHPIGTRKDFFEVCRQFGHASSKKFASPGLVAEYIGTCGSERDPSDFFLSALHGLG